MNKNNICGTKIKDEDEEEVIRGHRSNTWPFEDALVNSDIVNEVVKPITISEQNIEKSIEKKKGGGI